MGQAGNFYSFLKTPAKKQILKSFLLKTTANPRRYLDVRTLRTFQSLLHIIDDDRFAVVSDCHLTNYENFKIDQAAALVDDVIGKIGRHNDTEAQTAVECS